MSDTPGEQPSLDEIARRMQADEPDAYGVFADVFGKRIRRALLARGLPPADAESLATTIVGDIVIKLDQFEERGSGSFLRWANTVAFNTWRNAVRRPPVFLEDPNEVAEPPAFPDDAADTRSDLEELLESAIGQLSAVDQAIFHAGLDDPEDYAVRLGPQVGLKPGNVRVRFLRIKERLEGILKDKPAVQSWLAQLRSKEDNG